MKHGTAYIQPEDRSLLNRLRLSEYRRAEGFQIKDAAVLWNESDEQSHVLGVWQRGELIAWYERRGYSRTGEERPFPAHDPRFGLPKRDDLAFVVLEKTL